MPATAGIQYAAATVVKHKRSGIPGPRFRGDDAEFCAAYFTQPFSL
jgi:hypothetical protein